MKKIAILGATGYIGKSLAHEIITRSSESKLFLFSRSSSRLVSLAKELHYSGKEHLFLDLNQFNSYEYDVIINCSGVGDPKDLSTLSSDILEITLQVDDLILSYIKNRPDVVYVNISSGAVYGNICKKAATETSVSVLPNSIEKPQDFYSVAKIHAEARHRGYQSFQIIDIRVFAFFSQFVDTQGTFFMSQIADCLIHKKVFVTTDTDMTRDYITPYDLWNLIQILIIKRGNTVVDAYSSSPISKKKILSFLVKKYGLTCKITKIKKESSLLSKNVYYSKNMKAAIFGYLPTFTSLKGIDRELELLLQKNKK
jgi:nucleoside-diphosphate-sugar epimerase